MSIESFETVGELLESGASQFGDKTLLVTPEGEVSHSQMERMASGIACGFERLGVGKSDVVCQLLPNCEASLVNWMALSKLGAIHAPLNYEFRGAALSRIINLTEAKVLVLDESLQALVAEVVDELSCLQTIVYRADSDEFRPHPRLSKFDCHLLNSLEKPGAIPAPVEVCHFDTAMLIFTSGTTGYSKAVEISHRFALTWSEGYLEQWELKPDDVFYITSPLFHVDATAFTLLAAIRLGTKMVYRPKFSASRYLSDVRTHGATIGILVGAAVTFLFNQPRRADDADNPLRLVTVGPVPDFLDEFEQRFGVKTVTLYGQTEIGHIAIQPVDEPYPGHNNAGKLCGPYDVCIADNWDAPQPAGVVGEILVRGKRPFTLMTSYYKNPKATAEVNRNHWHHTGDLAYVDEEGYLYFVRRKKDAIRRRGENISAVEIEEALSMHPDVHECAVVGVPSEYTDEEVKAVVVLNPRSSLAPADIVAWCKGRLPQYAEPRYVEFVDAMPLTETAKVKKTQLREAWRNANTYDMEAGAYLQQ